MDIKYSEKDILALDKKFEYPDSDVKCPRCGKLLEFTSINNSSMVKCPTDDCLQGSCRGL